ncbi:IS630 family transposase [Thalassomonas viridans]|uniref:IS630 family transposase n=1 Tax=Thalassomonas viridans TaxID=137584 RepID=A0AAF0CAJ5_9GAMM|nr:IS630 family transposase [Thalassomonas viridans]WDE06375.1 IS630 family transposase [Thalassomonas viridans]WDE08115.1 IS630 family transposase [Thalassomonas viridans]WDE09165.1 IS630 family transposase [Thalassomonas viridans]
MHQLETIDFKSLARHEKNAQKRIRLLALAHFKEGMNRTEISKLLKVSRTSVNKWVAGFLSQGIDGLSAKPQPGRPPLLSAAQLQQIAKLVEQEANKDSGGRLKGSDINEFIKQEFGVIYEPSHVYRLLKKMGFSWITSRSKHPKQSDQVQESFKKFLLSTILNVPGHISLDKVDVWFQDEARFGQQNTTTRLWARTGTRPRAIKQQQFEYVYLFGAVCPATGATEAVIAPCVNQEVMSHHLAQISQRTPPGRYAVVLMDGASWHTASVANQFDNLNILKLPPYSPELNPIEQVWQWLRQNELANQCFAGYEDIVNKLTSAWNNFIRDEQMVKGICSRDWIELNS